MDIDDLQIKRIVANISESIDVNNDPSDELIKISSNLTNLNYPNDIDFYISLLENNKKLESIISRVVKTGASTFEEKTSNNLLDQDIGLSLMEAYCIINNIDLETESKNKCEEIIDDLNKYNLEDIDILTLYLREFYDEEPLTPEEEKEMIIKISNGDKVAREFFIIKNLRLVVSIAKKYLNQGMSFLDLIQEGNIGLLMATDKFDITRQTKFSTYATPAIRRRIWNAIRDDRNIRITQNMKEKISEYNEIVSNFQQKHYREPTITEVSNNINDSVGEVAKIYSANTNTISLYTVVDNDSQVELKDCIPSDDPTTEEAAMLNFLQKEIRSRLERANILDKEREVLMLRYGLKNANVEFKKPGKPTLQEIGNILGVSKERVGALETSALRKLRQSKKFIGLDDYIGKSPDESKELTSSNNKVLNKR